MSTRQRGLLLALTTAAISGLSVYLNAFGVKQVPDAAVYTTAKNGVAALVLLAALVAVGKLGEVRSLDRRTIAGLGLVGVIGGSIPFVLFFTGLAMATAPTAAFIHKTLFLWVALLAVPFLGERIGIATIAALGTLLAAQLLIAPPTGMAWSTGETLIAIATAFWSVEVIVAKRLLRTVSAPVLGAARMSAGLVILVGYLAVTGRLGDLAAISATGWTWVLVTGVLLAGYVASWYGALRLVEATTVTAVLVLGAVITGLLSAASKGAAPDPSVVVGYALVVAATALLIVAPALRRSPGAAHAVAGR